MTDKVIIRIPAATAYLGLVRATATALAALQDFTYDRVMDLHIAIDEIGSRMMATVDGLGRLEFEFDLEEDRLVITARGDGKRRTGVAFLNEWSEAILQAVTDKIDVDESGPRQAATFHVSQGVNRADVP